MPENNDGELYVAEYEGDLFVVLDSGRDEEFDDREHLAGHSRLFVVNADALENNGEDLADLLDRRVETAAFIPLLGNDDGNFSSAVCKILRDEITASRNMLILDRLEILPGFRGQELGLRFMRAAITRFGLGCRVAAIKPFPLQFEEKLGGFTPGERGAESRLISPSKIERAAFRAATMKLKTYYAREGFVSLRGSDLMILDLWNDR